LAPHRYFWFTRDARKSPHWDTRDLYPANFQELVL
jgi:hypothetical protein